MSAPGRQVESPRWLCPLSSRAVGVGSSVATVRRFGPPSPWWPGPFVSEVRGVGSRPGDDEEPGALVGRADVGRSYNRPFRIEPEVGKVSEDVGKPKSKVS